MQVQRQAGGDAGPRLALQRLHQQLDAAPADLGIRLHDGAQRWCEVVAEGDAVGEDQDLVIIESMKMQIPVGSPEEGTVKKVFVAPEQFLNEGDPIVELG